MCIRDSLSAARTGLDIDESITGVQFAGKHSLEFQISHHPSTFLQIANDFGHCGFVAFLASQDQQFGRFIQTPVKAFQPVDDRFQLSAFLAERLRPLRIAPDIGFL